MALTCAVVLIVTGIVVIGIGSAGSTFPALEPSVACLGSYRG